ncbi:hypothetical protein C8R46DRAFT_1192313 [Mycena filopes]|nr:hypothetical protein C8R46DRAFT_1192313 [Mycena filopes]
MDSGLLSLPSDLILEISMHLNLSDSIDLLSTCKVLRQCLAEKSFWIHTLARLHHESRHPIAVPLLQDLSALTLADLQEAGKRTSRLIKNWRSEAPRPESVREMYVDLVAEIILIPGTNLIITHGRGFVACWDLLRKCPVGRLVEEGLEIESATFGEYGKAMLGAIKTDSYCFEVAAICVDYRDRKAVSITLHMQHMFVYPRRHFYQASQVTVDPDAVRLVVTGFDPWDYTLLSVSLAGEEQIIYGFMPGVTREIASYGPPKVSIIPTSNGNYFLRHRQTFGELTHLSTRAAREPAPTLVHRIIPLAAPNHSFQFKHLAPADPTAAIMRITTGQFLVEFWHAARDRDADGEPVFGDVAVHTYLCDCIVNSVVVGASGMYALLALRPLHEDEAALRLVRCGFGGAPDARDMRVEPEKTLYAKEGQIALDDRLGLIVSVRGDGRLRVASYA